MTKLAPDTATVISLIGTAARLLNEGMPRPEIVQALKDIAGGRGDLLGRAAGHHIGSYLGSKGTHWQGVDAAVLLIQAGADPKVVVQAADETRRNVEQERHVAIGPEVTG